MTVRRLQRGTIAVEVPACRSAVTAPPKEEQPNEVNGMTATISRKPYSILITDDDRGCREALRDIVEPEGYRAVLASSGEEALEIVRGERVHLVLLDMHMPTLTGLETLQLLRQNNDVLPCVLVTADATERLIRQALRAHAYSVIAKPVSKNIVLYTVVRALFRAYGGPERASDWPSNG
jgi:CheY-like chemotaxis protein